MREWDIKTVGVYSWYICLGQSGKGHTESKRKYRVYCRQVTAYHLGCWEGLWKMVTLFLGWSAGQWDWRLGRESWRRKKRAEQRQMLHWKLPPSQPVILMTWGALQKAEGDPVDFASLSVNSNGALVPSWAIGFQNIMTPVSFWPKSHETFSCGLLTQNHTGYNRLWKM